MTVAGHTTSSRAIRARVGIGAVVVLLIVGLAIAVVVSTTTSPGASQSIITEPRPSGKTTSGAAASDSATIFVHVLGAVGKPGLYQLRDGTRAVDAIAAAGGYAEIADQAQLNLARFVSDGEQIYVPAIGEKPPAGSPAASGTIGGKVNINTADAATLETLPRVGPAMAERIIAWRKKNGRFTSVKDLMGVTGIGDKTFAELKNHITI
jgi:competence protein ComEA